MHYHTFITSLLLIHSLRLRFKFHPVLTHTADQERALALNIYKSWSEGIALFIRNIGGWWTDPSNTEGINTTYTDLLQLWYTWHDMNTWLKATKPAVHWNAGIVDHHHIAILLIIMCRYVVTRSLRYCFMLGSTFWEASKGHAAMCGLCMRWINWPFTLLPPEWAVIFLWFTLHIPLGPLASCSEPTPAFSLHRDFTHVAFQ